MVTNKDQMNMAQHSETGQMPEQGLLAAAYIPYQREDSPRYDKENALKNGTLFPGLNLPYANYVPTKDVANSPKGQLMAMSFVLGDLQLYLDTHPEDKEALKLHNAFVDMYDKAVMEYEKLHGPVTADTVMPEHYTWVNNPWPWDEK